MAEPGSDTTQPAANTFVWHPEYAGKSFESVERELANEIEHDQRSYHLALEQAEKEEHGSFNIVRELEKRWSVYDFGWFDVPSDVLAKRIVAFERARDERQELMSWQEWKAESPPQPQTGVSRMPEEKRDWRENLTDEQRKRLASGLSVLTILIFVLICAVVYFVVT